MNNIIEAINLKKHYKNQPFLFSNLNFKVSLGESVAIIGKSGTGKSSLLHILAGFDNPTEGSVCFNGVDLHQISSKELNIIHNNHFGFIYQNFFLLKEFNVVENVALPLMIRGINKNESINQALQYLEKIDLKDKAFGSSLELSGGEKQRVAICRALISKPSFLFADEPTGNLDDRNTEIIFNLLTSDLQKTALILVTHNSLLASKCDRILDLSNL